MSDSQQSGSRLPWRPIAITAVVLAIIASASAAVLWFAPVLTVATISVDGTERLEPAQVAAASEISVGENLLHVDAGAAAAQIAELPWVASATVERAFPDTVRIEVRERDTLAVITAEDGPHLIDSHGEEFIIDVPPEGTVEITGTDPGTEEQRAAVAILSAIEPELRSQFARIQVNSPYSFELHHHDGRVIVWGANDNNANKALALATVLTQPGQRWNISHPEIVTTSP